MQPRSLVSSCGAILALPLVCLFACFVLACAVMVAALAGVVMVAVTLRLMLRGLYSLILHPWVAASLFAIACFMLIATMQLPPPM